MSHQTNKKRGKMKTITLKKLNRSQLVKLIKNNHPNISFNKRTSLKNLRLKFDMLGGENANVKFDNKFKLHPQF